MKTLKLISFFSCLSLFIVESRSQNNVAPDVSFTDIEGNSYSIYGLLDEGYKVILVYGGYEDACWIKEWQDLVGSELWQHYGPDGDNTVRMFFIDEAENQPPFSISTDESVANYTSEMGVQYPVVNLEAPLAGYPVSGTPHYYAICLDKTYYESGGFGEDESLAQMIAFLSICEGADLSNDVYFKGFYDEPSFCTKDNQHSFIPEMYLMLSTENTTTEELNQAYSITFSLNGVVQDTFNFPPSNGENGLHADIPSLKFTTVNTSDTLLYTLTYPNDTYLENNSFQYIIPNDLENSPTSNTAVNTVVLGSEDVYGTYNLRSVLDNEVQSLYYLEDSILTLNLSDANCYSIKYNNSLFFQAELRDENNTEIFTIAPEVFYPMTRTPWLYFNVKSSVGINETTFPDKTQLVSLEFYDMMGKKQNIAKPLAVGVYIELKRYKSGYIESRKIYIN